MSCNFTVVIKDRIKRNKPLGIKHTQFIMNLQVISNTLIKNFNQQLDRTDFMIETGLPRTTIYDHLRRLTDNGYLLKENVRKGKGRPKSTWKLEETTKLLNHLKQFNINLTTTLLPNNQTFTKT